MQRVSLCAGQSQRIETPRRERTHTTETKERSDAVASQRLAVQIAVVLGRVCQMHSTQGIMSQDDARRV